LAFRSGLQLPDEFFFSQISHICNIDSIKINAFFLVKLLFSLAIFKLGLSYVYTFRVINKAVVIMMQLSQQSNPLAFGSRKLGAHITRTINVLFRRKTKAEAID
jgi:hypothetical protein